MKNDESMKDKDVRGRFEGSKKWRWVAKISQPNFLAPVAIETFVFWRRSLFRGGLATVSSPGQGLIDVQTNRPLSHESKCLLIYHSGWWTRLSVKNSH